MNKKMAYLVDLKTIAISKYTKPSVTIHLSSSSTDGFIIDCECSIIKT